MAVDMTNDARGYTRLTNHATAEFDASPPQTSWQYRLVSAMLAFFLWGGWAYFVNSHTAAIDGAPPLTAALTQGTGSFIITLLMVRSVTWLYRRLPATPLRLVLPALFTVLVTGSCLATAHALVGTPNIVGTITPGLTVAFAFNVYTTIKLWRRDAARFPTNRLGELPVE
ncbi:MAG: hypothetical protein R3C10_05355 [Pirellulales bacterium]